MTSLVLDTHSLLRYWNDPDKLSKPAAFAIDQAVNDGYPLFVSSVALSKQFIWRRKEASKRKSSPAFYSLCDVRTRMSWFSRSTWILPRNYSPFCEK
jgi:hypothetical protein